MEKKTFLALILPAFCGCITGPGPAGADSTIANLTVYYWAGGEKIILTVNRKTVIGFYKPDSTHPYRSPEILYFDFAQTSPLPSIVESRGFEPDEFEWLSFGYTYQGGEVLPTNRIGFSLKSGYTQQSLEDLIRGDAVFDSTPYGTPQLKVVKQDGDVFGIANRVYESGLVDYCTPDFIARIALSLRTSVASDIDGQTTCNVRSRLHSLPAGRARPQAEGS